MITQQEIDNLESAINAAVKQTSLLLLLAQTAKSTGDNSVDNVVSVRDLLATSLVYANALATIDKLKEEAQEYRYGR